MVWFPKTANGDGEARKSEIRLSVRSRYLRGLDKKDEKASTPTKVNAFDERRRVSRLRA